MVCVFRSTATDPTARGREFGEHFAQKIGRGIEIYRSVFQRVAGQPVDLRAFGTEALAQTAAFAPELHLEMLGMAQGANVDAELIGALNARTEILAALDATLRGECSTIVGVDASGGAPLAVQTWDWYSEFADQWLVWEIPQADGGLTTTVTEFGILGKIGVNSRGLGLHFNILHHERDGGAMGVPVHVLARAVLDGTGDLNRALKLIQSTRVSASSSLTLIATVDRDSAVVSAEVYPGGPGLVFPSPAGLLVHTNHFLSQPAAMGDTEPRSFPDTLVRHDLLTRRLTQEKALDLPRVLSAMNSHLGTTGAVCCHPDVSLPASGQYATLATVILDVRTGKLEALAGGPCGQTRARSAAREVRNPIEVPVWSS
jgi:isopenicillin-N N-acyltransferase like protein